MSRLDTRLEGNASFAHVGVHLAMCLVQHILRKLPAELNKLVNLLMIT